MRVGLFLQILTIFVPASNLSAQEPISGDSATQPSPGHFILKEQFRFISLDLDHGPRADRGQTRDYQLLTTINYGLTKDWSLSLRTPVISRRRSFDLGDRMDRAQGVGDVTLLAKWRFYRNDHGPLDTTRIAALGGAEIRTGDGPFTNDAYNPAIGLAATHIAGRHGLNGNLQWTFTTDGASEPTYAGMSTADVLRYNGAYLYRLHPETFDENSSGGAWYAVAELNGTYETNGDNELLLSPGLMYEASTWTLELSLQLPAWRDVSNRPETEYALVVGLRFAF
jgi:hypothetical protein